MIVAMYCDVLLVLGNKPDYVRKGTGIASNHVKSGSGTIFVQDLQDCWSPMRIRAIIKGQVDHFIIVDIFIGSILSNDDIPRHTIFCTSRDGNKPP